MKLTDKDASIGTCRIYKRRFGEHETIAGDVFKCIPMMIRLKHEPAPKMCGYSNVTRVDGVPVVIGKA